MLICKQFAPTTHRVPSRSDPHTQRIVAYGYRTIATCNCPAFAKAATGVLVPGTEILLPWCYHLDQVAAKVCTWAVAGQRVPRASSRLSGCPRCRGPIIHVTNTGPMPYTLEIR